MNPEVQVPTASSLAVESSGKVITTEAGSTSKASCAAQESDSAAAPVSSTREGRAGESASCDDVEVTVSDIVFGSEPKAAASDRDDQGAVEPTSHPSSTLGPEYWALRKRLEQAREEVKAAKALEQRYQSEVDGFFSDSDVDSDCSCCQEDNDKEPEPCRKKQVTSVTFYEVLVGIEPNSERATILSMTLGGEKRPKYPNLAAEYSRLIRLPLTIKVKTQTDKEVEQLMHDVSLGSRMFKRGFYNNH